MNPPVAPSAQIRHKGMQVPHYLASVAPIPLPQFRQRQKPIRPFMQNYLLVASTDGATVRIAVLVEELLDFPPLRASKVLVIFIIAKLRVIHRAIVQVVYGTDEDC